MPKRKDKNWFRRNRHKYPADWECEACGHAHDTSPHALTVDHLDHDPQNNYADNLMVLCQSCHMKRHAQIPHAYSREDALQKLKWRLEAESRQMRFPLFD